MKRVTKAILLVAGLGSRLRPLTNDIPKCLVEVGGQTLIERILLQLKRCGIEDVFLVTGYMAETLRNGVSHFVEIPRLTFVNNPDFDTLGNAVSVRYALQHIENNAELADDESCLIADGDVLIKEDSVFKNLFQHPSMNVLAVECRDDLGDEEMKVILKPGSDRVAALSKKLDPEKSVGESMGVQLINRKTAKIFLQQMSMLTQEQLQSLYYEDVFALNSNNLATFAIDRVPVGAFIEIDTLEDLEDARALAKSW